MQPEGFDKQCLRNMLGDQYTPWGRFPQFAHEPLDRRSQCRFISLAGEVEYSRQFSEKALCMPSNEVKVASDTGAMPPSVNDPELADRHFGKKIFGINRGNVSLGIEPECPPLG
ncbi:hypothetical protein LMG18091_03783 [Ralstonia wenshanensis]|uniref:Uncharacterized protein n=1 Tax=Ralstonia wenshanensis TaxID=2842456 RepID=A0AAD2ESL1_9RALS|nr:hypothetical protein LMG18091_03783 [Ralstonia wenshanensis]